MHAAVSLLDAFRDATGLRTNWNKSAATPIRCQGITVDAVMEGTLCSAKALPITYLGLPLSDVRLRRQDLKPILDSLAKRLRGWKAKLISLPGRIELVRTTLTAMAIYRIMALAPPAWFVKMVDRLRRGFLWAADETAPAGKCLVNWRQVCCPRELGGLGVHDLQRQGAALRARWSWRKWTDEGRSWHDLITNSDPAAEGVFRAATTIVIGDGRKTNFWRAHWAQGCRPADRWPNLFGHCNGRRLTLRDAIINNNWLRYVKADLPQAVLHELCDLWEVTRAISLTEGATDQIKWKLTASGQYMASSAYRMQFHGSIPTNDNTVIWSAKAAPRAKAFAWILLKGRCLTVDNLARRQIAHDPLCPLCRSEQETGLHLISTCPFSLQVWARTAASLSQPFAAIDLNRAGRLRDRFRRQTASIPRAHRATWRATCLLVSWCLRKERNARIFEGKACNELQVANRIIGRGPLLAVCRLSANEQVF